MDSFEKNLLNLGIEKIVLERLQQEFPLKISYENIINKKNIEDFWNIIDLLPKSLSFELHKLQLKKNLNISHDFTEDFLTNSLEEFSLINSKKKINNNLLKFS